jgi:hypothetical protein
MDFLSFFEMHVKPASVSCDWLIADNAIRFAINGIRDRAVVCRRSGGIVCNKMDSSESHGQSGKIRPRRFLLITLSRRDTT